MLRVLITRPRAQSAELGAALQQAGFEPIYFPVIEIRPAQDLTSLREALAHLEQYAWLIFTSVNAVEIVLQHWPSPATSRHKSKAKIAAVGPKTAEALQRSGIEPDFIPATFTGLDILPGLGDVRGQHILLPRADLARPDLSRAIAAAGGLPEEIIVYHTLPATPDPLGWQALQQGVNVITFTSPSTVENFCALLRQNQIDPLHLPEAPKIVCIGPVTAQAARQAGFSNVVVARESTREGLLHAIRETGNQLAI
ncbi:MAG: uroporphyrinogen-III synthase [Anaerolineae bacterium]